jgi:regulation of enolase protein 1 (concanavalin A-like superfamily)
MFMGRCLPLVVVCLFVSGPAFAADEGIPVKKLEELKAATVYIKVDAKEASGTGSGFLILVAGDAGFVVTNHHVVAVPARVAPPKVSLVFGSGTRMERELTAEILASDPETDLAVLKVISKDLPTPLSLTPTATPHETMTVYTFGFPLGKLLSPTKGNPAITIGKGAISSFREDERGRLKRLQLDGDLNPGNSGGPIVDAEGKLVGIAVSHIIGTKISFAIPPAELGDLLKGRVANVTIQSIRVDKGEAEVEIEVPCLDPLHKIQALELRHARKDALKDGPAADKDGNWPLLPGSEKVELRMEGSKGKARVTLRSPEKQTVPFLFQTVYRNGDGKSITTQPLTRAINFGVAGVVRPTDPNAGLGRVWETVTSKEGGFTIEMPVKPTIAYSRTRRGPGGMLRILTVGCETDGGVYLAYRVDFPGVIRGPEDRLLDATRDGLAEDCNGKVISEKRVRAEGKLGRDFTIRGTPFDDSSVVTIRVREYFVGRSVFAVGVISPPNQDLPEDAGRFLGSLALGEARARAAGTPEPEPKGTDLPGWGLAIDPDKDCKFVPEGKNLSIQVPGTHHDLHPDTGKLNAPRALREVEGDFVLSVKVAGEFQPGLKSTFPRSVPYNGAGILCWSDADNFIRLERGALSRNGMVGSTVAFEEREGGYRGAVHNEVFQGGTCYLRLERKGSRIAGAISIDGKNWRELKPIDTVWPAKLRVGLTAISTSSDPFVVKFEEFELLGNGPEKP